MIDFKGFGNIVIIAYICALVISLLLINPAMPNYSKYYFGRLNLMALYDMDKKKDYLLSGLESTKILIERGYGWGFFEVSVYESYLGEFIVGYLAKFIPSSDEEVVDVYSHKFSRQLLENKTKAKAKFFLHVHTGVMAYHPVNPQISRDNYCRKFVKLFEDSKDGLFIQADIQPIQEDRNIFEAIKKFSSIKRLTIQLHPSNPSSTPVWSDWDDHMKTLEVIYYKEEFIADRTLDKSSLKIEGEKIVESKIHMAEDGYGRAEIEGKIDGETKVISTGDNPTIASVSANDEDTESVFLQIKDKLSDLFSRFSSI